MFGHRVALFARRHWPWPTALVLTCLVAPPARTPGATRSEVQAPKELSNERVGASALRGRADAARRGGRFGEALGLYRELECLDLARDDDRMHARVWSARMRLERGERSALFDVEVLIDGGMDPAATARFVLALRRIQGRDTFDIVQGELAALESKCVDALARRSRSGDENGARALRWLRRLNGDG